MYIYIIIDRFESVALATLDKQKAKDTLSQDYYNVLQVWDDEGTIVAVYVPSEIDNV